MKKTVLIGLISISSLTFMGCANLEINGAKQQYETYHSFVEKAKKNIVKRQIDEDKLYSLMKKDKNLLIVDVRTFKEFKKGHIPNSVLIQRGIIEKMLPKRYFKPEDGKKIVVYCHSGKRSAMVTEQLMKMGYDVYNLEGGYKSWTKKYKIKK